MFCQHCSRNPDFDEEINVFFPVYFLSVRIDFDTKSCSLQSLPQVRLVPGGMFLCGEATSLSYLPVISVGWQGTTLSLAPEPQASPGHQTASPHYVLFERVVV